MNEIILGVPRSHVRLASHDPRWLDCYTAAETDLKRCLGNRLTAIEHVGSTAVPGLDAKPIIDIMVGVEPGFAARLHDGPRALGL